MKYLCLLVLACLSFVAHAAPKAELWPMWRVSGDSTGVDHSQWQNFLKRFVSVGDDGINRVDYREIRANGQAALTQYLEYMSSLDPRAYTMDEQMAYWINLYNAVTIQVVLSYPRKKSILRMGEKFFAIGPWDDPVVSVAGERLTLNDIEHRILRPIWQDHRIHYAVNCASLGCPDLSSTAYTAQTLESQLQHAEVAYLAHPRGVSVAGRVVTLSTIFKWYRSDFGRAETDVLDYVAGFNPLVRQLLQTGKKGPRVRYEYDWALNALALD